ncbi:MAG TPA: hypothetical protein ENK81_02605 [Euryarchaeota archaeon]|nr:hypothetical protein [Euryarchaeota archaeon]
MRADTFTRISRKTIRRIFLMLDLIFIALFLLFLYYAIKDAYVAGFYSANEQINILLGDSDVALEWQRMYVTSFWHLIRDVVLMGISLVWIIFRSLRNELLLGRSL